MSIRIFHKRIGGMSDAARFRATRLLDVVEDLNLPAEPESIGDDLVLRIRWADMDAWTETLRRAKEDER